MYRYFKAPSFDCVSEITALPREGMGVEDEYKRQELVIVVRDGPDILSTTTIRVRAHVGHQLIKLLFVCLRSTACSKQRFSTRGRREER